VALDQFGQVIDVFVSSRRDTKAAQRFFERAIGTTKIAPTEVSTDQAPVDPAVLEDLLPAAWHRTDRYANNRVECRSRQAEGAAGSDARAQTGPQCQSDHRRTRLDAEPSARTRRAGGGGAHHRRVAVAFDELVLAI
jgi:DDE domain